MKLLQVNLQQGLLVDYEEVVVGAYSHWKKVIYVKGRKIEREELPEEVRDYDIKVHVDHFSITRWTNEGNEEL